MMCHIFADGEDLLSCSLPEMSVVKGLPQGKRITMWKPAECIKSTHFLGVPTYVDYDGTIVVQTVPQGEFFAA